jgi:hypothetical protein
LLAADIDVEPVSMAVLVGRGFTDEVSSVELADGRQVVLRRWGDRRPAEFARAAFLNDHTVPAPRLLSAEEFGSLVEFAAGRLLGDLIEAKWNAAGGSKS